MNSIKESPRPITVEIDLTNLFHYETVSQREEPLLIAQFEQKRKQLTDLCLFGFPNRTPEMKLNIINLRNELNEARKKHWCLDRVPMSIIDGEPI